MSRNTLFRLGIILWVTFLVALASFEIFYIHGLRSNKNDKNTGTKHYWSIVSK
jgi:hypothetical protein